MPETEEAARIVHFTTQGTSGVCGSNPRSASPNPFTVAFDVDDDAINCPLCRMYAKGFREARRRFR